MAYHQYVMFICDILCCDAVLFVLPAHVSCVLFGFMTLKLKYSIIHSKLLQVTHVRSLHTSTCGQQHEAVAEVSEPEPFSVFRTHENDPVSESGFTSFKTAFISNRVNAHYSILFVAGVS